MYLPRWRGGPPCALDFAVTSGMREDMLVGSAQDNETALTAYEDHKLSFKDTHAQCRDSGFTFIPMVMEAVGGGWGKDARRVWSELAKKISLTNGELETENDSAIALLQRLSLILHRENARAVVRRMGAMVAPSTGEALSIAAAIAEDDAELCHPC